MSKRGKEKTKVLPVEGEACQYSMGHCAPRGDAYFSKPRGVRRPSPGRGVYDKKARDRTWSLKD